YLALNQEQKALQALENAVQYEPGIVEYKLALASLYRDLGRFQQSATLYEELIKENPDNGELNFNLIDLYIRLQDFEGAIRVLNNAEQNFGMHEAFSLQKYNLYGRLGNPEKALEELIRLAEKFPFESRYLYILGDVYLKLNQENKALEYYEKAHQSDPSDPQYAIAMVNYYLSKNDEQAIEKLFSELMEQYSQEVELNRIYGNYLLSKNRLEEAKFQFRIITETDPGDYDTWRNMLSIVLQEDNLEEVISICDNALIHFPEIPEFYFYKGIAFYQQGRYQEALITYHEGLEHITNMNRAIASGFYGQIGDVQYQIGDKEAAYEAYDKALEFNENNLLILNNYAYFLSLDKRELDKAERMSSRTIQAEPNNPTYLDTYAWIFYLKENYTLAKVYIESAINKGGGKSPEILEHYGDILFRVGQKEPAVREWKKALDLFTEDEDKIRLEEKIKNNTL
ncbi:tetratricopeptide repeat protein, partial [Bacteroidales bacterium OttesenSCG-928-A17]|nr:tetratricopeptide repeat protein [Bacteroidales bacterium OttesenSCG-928-A17]